jgi:uncharacterized protein YegJ (DUF2314 family)
MTTRGASIVLAIMTLSGCGRGDQGQTTSIPGQAPIIYVKDDDPKMQAAIDKARATADQFIAALANPKPAQTGFAVKIQAKDGAQNEHMWINSVRYQDGVFTGILNNDPKHVKNVKLGDQVKTAKNEISDWMYVENKKLIGGYTIRVLRDNMPPEERREFERSVPFTLD